MATTPKQFFEQCEPCGGSGRAAPDEGIHELVPDNNVKLKPRQRTVRVCPNCSGRGFSRTPVTDRFVRELIEEHNDALEVIQQFNDLVITSSLEHGVNYLTDPGLAEINFRGEGVLGRARAAGRRDPDRPGLRR